MTKITLTQRVAGLAAIGLLASGLAGAAPVLLSAGGKATGIQDLVVDGINYDVSFVFGTYNSVFATELPTFFGNGAGAVHARDAIWSLLNGSSLRVGNVPSRPFGNLSVVYGDLLNGTYWASTRTSYSDGTGTVWQHTAADLGGYKNVDYGYNNYGFAVFTADPIAVPGKVPEPGSAALVGIALLGLGLGRRKKH
nr:PEP-CTERM sorting domain-containing protein [uncultured Roseateles sp.]